jgi:hypothetical protein
MKSHITCLLILISVLTTLKITAQTVNEPIEFRGIQFNQGLNSNSNFQPVSTEHPYRIPKFGYFALMQGDNYITKNMREYDRSAESQRLDKVTEAMRNNPSSYDSSSESKHGFAHFETMAHERRFIAYRRNKENLNIGKNQLTDIIYLSNDQDKEIVCVIVFSKSRWESRNETPLRDNWDEQVSRRLISGVNQVYSDEFKEVFDAIVTKYKANVVEERKFTPSWVSSYPAGRFYGFERRRLISAKSDNVTITGCFYNLIDHRTGLKDVIFSKPYYAIGIVNNKYLPLLQLKDGDKEAKESDPLKDL